jgi:hypothetical protein
MMAQTQGARQCATSPPRPTELITGYVGISLPVPLQATRPLPTYTLDWPLLGAR